MISRFLASFPHGRFLPICLILFSLSCADEAPKEDEKISMGLIEYSIEYPQIPADSYLLDLMPKSMETTFSDGHFRSDIVAAMGLFKTSVICQKGQTNLIHSVKMLDKKKASTLNYDEIREFNPNFRNIEIAPTDEVKEIAGYTCKSSVVTVKGDSSWTFKLYYTDEIDIPKSNQHTPFKDIEGVLMQYDLVSYDTHMRFIAEKVSAKDDITLEEIQLEEGYESVTPDELKKEIESIFDKVK